MSREIRRGRGLSKPRRAAAILEATLLTTSLVLLGWLTLWLIHQKDQGLRLEAWHLPDPRLRPETTPWLAGDVKVLKDDPDGAPAAGTCHASP